MTETYSIANPSHFNGINPILSQLRTEIEESIIATSLNAITSTGDVVDIEFASSISIPDKTTLDGLVSSHAPTVVIPYTILGTITPRNTEFSNTSYIRIGSFVYQGTNHSDSITKISCVAYKDTSVTNYSIRIYDSKNNAEIANETFTNNTEDHIEITTINNLPVEEGILEVQIKKNGGTGNTQIHIDSITFYSS